MTCVDPLGLHAFTACRLIPLNKNPGVRPIGIAEALRRITAKAILAIVKQDVETAAGSLQVCAGQEGGCEAAVHAMRQVFSAAEDNAVLLVDASNAFNSLHRLATLHNTRILCPAFATILINTYRRDADLFVLGGHRIKFMEGTTQGDLLAMPMYAIGVKPLITYLHMHNESHQTWYADDATAAASLPALRRWWDILCAMGPRLGYFVNATKTSIIVHDSELDLARNVSQGTSIKITSVGQRHLGAVLGSVDST